MAGQRTKWLSDAEIDAAVAAVASGGVMPTSNSLIPAENARVNTVTITPLTLRGGGLYSRFRADDDDAFRAFFAGRTP